MNLTPISLARKEKYNGFGIKAINKRFKNAVMSGQLNAVRYFLLVEKVNIHLEKDFVFRIACKRGYLDIIEYVLTSNELNEHCNINIDNDIGIKRACEFGHLEVVKFLSSSPKIKKHADVFCRNNILFDIAKTNNKIDIEKYLLYFQLSQALLGKKENRLVKI